MSHDPAPPRNHPAPVREVDARNLLCPLPLLRAQAAMPALAPGEVLAVRATDPGLHRDLPAWCIVQGHELLTIRQEGRELVGLVKKGPS